MKTTSRAGKGMAKMDRAVAGIMENNVLSWAAKSVAIVCAVALALIFFPAHAFAAEAPVLVAIPDITIQKNSAALVKFINLRQYASDAANSPDTLAYEIAGQSNPELIDCFLQDTYFISCKAPAKDGTGANEITVRAMNSFGLGDADTFSFNVRDSTTAAGQQPSTSFSLDMGTLALEAGQTTGVMVTVRNNTDAETCYTIAAVFGGEERRQFYAQPSQKSFCLDAGEETSVWVTITALRNALAGTHIIGFSLGSTDFSETKTLLVRVVNTSEQVAIERAGSYYICNEPFLQKLRLRVTNNTGSRKEITLSTQHELFLPRFEFPRISVNAGSLEEADMELHVNETTATGDYKVQVRANYDNTFVQREVAFRLVECAKNYFDLSVSPERRAIMRGESRNFTIRLVSLSDTDQIVELGADGNVSVQLERASVLLPANGSREVVMRASTATEQGFGLHDVKVYAWNQHEEEQETVKVEVGGEHSVALSVKANDLEVRQGSASSRQVFEVTVENKGAFTEDVRLAVDRPILGMNVEVSDPSIRLTKGEGRKVHVFVVPGPEAEKGKYSTTLRATYGGKEARLGLRFRVLEATERPGFGSLEMTSYPTELELVAGKEKLVQFVVTNPNTSAAENVKLRMTGLGDDVSFLPQGVGNIGAGKSATVTAKVFAQPDAVTATYFTKLEATADGRTVSKDITIKVRANNRAGAEKAETGVNGKGIDGASDGGMGKDGTAGLVALGSSGTLFLAGAAIIILLAAIILVVTLLDSGKSNQGGTAD